MIENTRLEKKQIVGSLGNAIINDVLHFFL
jgi:hypothetical protein